MVVDFRRDHDSQRNNAVNRGCAQQQYSNDYGVYVLECPAERKAQDAGDAESPCNHQVLVTFGEVFFAEPELSLIHISEPTRLLSISYAVFCLKKKKNK